MLKWDYMIIRLDQAHTTPAEPHKNGNKKVELSLSEAIPGSSTSKDCLPKYSQNFLNKTGHSSQTNRRMKALTAISQEPDQAKKRTNYETFFAKLFNGSYSDAELTDDNLDERIRVLQEKLQERFNFNEREQAGMTQIGKIMAHPAASPVAAVVAAMTLLVSAAGNIPGVADFAESYVPNNSIVDSWSSEPVTNGLERFKRFGLEGGLVGRTFKVGDFLSTEGKNFYLTSAHNKQNHFFRRVYELFYAQTNYFKSKGMDLNQMGVMFDNQTNPGGNYPLTLNQNDEGHYFILHIPNVDLASNYAKVIVD